MAQTRRCPIISLSSPFLSHRTPGLSWAPGCRGHSHFQHPLRRGMATGRRPSHRAIWGRDARNGQAMSLNLTFPRPSSFLLFLSPPPPQLEGRCNDCALSVVILNDEARPGWELKRAGQPGEKSPRGQARTDTSRVCQQKRRHTCILPRSLLFRAFLCQLDLILIDTA